MFPLEERCLNNAKQITEKVKDFTMLYDKRLFKFERLLENPF